MKTLIAAAAVIGLSLAVRHFVPLPVSMAQTDAAPQLSFTIHYAIEHEANTPTGVRKEFWTAEAGRGSDGSMYERQDGSVSYAYDAKTRKLQEFDLAVSMVSTTTVSQEEVTARRAVRTSCPAPGEVYRFAGSDKILGVDVVKYSTSKPDGSTESSVWLAPSYNCAFLRDEVIYRQNGQITGQHVRRATLIVQGEPDRRLFSAPDGLKEVPPSEIEFARFRARTTSGTPVPECLRKSTRIPDAQYSKQPPRK